MVHEELTPRARRHDDNLRRILDTALALVEREGVEALSIQKLAAAVHYTPGALYRYFASKDQILAQLVLRALGDARAEIDRARALCAPDEGPLTRVAATAYGYRAFARRWPARFGLLASTLADARVLVTSDDDAAPLVAAMLGTLGLVADDLAAVSLSPGEPGERALCLFSLVQGTLQLEKQARRSEGRVDTARLVGCGLGALLVGWGAEPAAVDRALARGESIGLSLSRGDEA